jgi:hypothetical protein
MSLRVMAVTPMGVTVMRVAVMRVATVGAYLVAMAAMPSMRTRVVRVMRVMSTMMTGVVGVVPVVSPTMTRVVRVMPAAMLTRVMARVTAQVSGMPWIAAMHGVTTVRTDVKAAATSVMNRMISNVR